MEKRKKEAEAIVKDRLERERTAFRLQEILLENDIPSEFLLACADLITPAHYADVVEERALVLTCGYPPCNNQIDEKKYKSKQKYHISLSEKKVYDVTMRKLFCSDECLVASNLFKSTISEVPLALREKKPMPNLAEYRKNRGKEVTSSVSDPVQRIPMSNVLMGDMYYNNPMANTPEAKTINIVERKLDDLHLDSESNQTAAALAIDGYRPKLEKAATPNLVDEIPPAPTNTTKPTSTTTNTVTTNTVTTNTVTTNTVTTNTIAPATSPSSSSRSISPPDCTTNTSEDYADYDDDDDSDFSDSTGDDENLDEQEQMMRMFMPKKDPKFSITLTEFGTIWNTLTGWCSSRTLKFLKSSPGTPPPPPDEDDGRRKTDADDDSEEDDGRTLPPVDGVTTERARIKVLSTTLGRYVSQLKTELRLSSPLDQELYHLLSTFNLHSAIGAYNTKQWTTFCLVFIIALAGRNPPLKAELTKNKAYLKALLQKHSIREDEFAVFVEVFHGNYAAI